MTSTESRSITIAESAGPLSNSSPELSEEEQLAFQLALGSLMQKRVRLYTSGESTSLPQSAVHNMLLSICYTLGIDLDAPSPHRVREVTVEGMEEVFQRELNALKEKTAQSADLCLKANLCTPPLESIALEDTLKSIQKLSQVYDYHFCAHEVPADIDYPLAHPVSESTQGIDYINEYLNRLIIEGTFMQNFELNICQALLESVHKEYRHLLINLYEPIATNAIGLVLAGKSPLSLHVSDEDRSAIAETLDSLSPRSISKKLSSASELACSALKIEDPAQKDYLEETARLLGPRLKNALDKKALAGVFLSCRK